MPSGAHIVLSGIQLVLAGIGVGLLVAAPIGPVNVLCIQRAVAKGFWGGLAAGLGAVLGDGLLAAIAAFSMTAISDLMIAYSGPIQLFGGALLIVFGIGLLFARPMLMVAPGQKSHLWDHWGIIPQTFFLTISNPPLNRMELPSSLTCAARRRVRRGRLLPADDRIERAS